MVILFGMQRCQFLMFLDLEWEFFYIKTRYRKQCTLKKYLPRFNVCNIFVDYLKGLQAYDFSISKN